LFGKKKYFFFFFIKFKTMTIVNSKDFITNEDTYFDMAMNEEVFVQRDNIMFIVAQAGKNATGVPAFPFSAGLWADYDIDDRTLRSIAWGTHKKPAL
jgi:hypothetical protein